MKIALVQINPTVGAVEENADRILEGIRRARSQGARLAVLSELVVSGYPPNDLLERPAFVAKCAEAEARIVAEIPDGITVVFGSLTAEGTALYNSAVIAERGEVCARAHKMLLPVYDVFDEARYFRLGSSPTIVEVDGIQIGVTICEDLWNDKTFWRQRRYDVDPVEDLAARGAQIIVNLSSSPWCQGKAIQRQAVVAHTARRHDCWVFYANQVGGNDGLIFDGQSTAHAPGGDLVAVAAAWREDTVVVDTDIIRPIDAPQRAVIEDIENALVLGIRDYFGKLNLPRAVIALSGGIDSAVTAYLAVRALGADAVRGLAMPSRYSSEGSVTDAEVLAQNLGIALDTVAIEPIFAAHLAQLAPVFGDRPEDVTEENLQARIRGALVMALANKTGGVVLTTGNKSESAVGYCTLYGDTNGGLAPIADLYKGQVYALARYANRDREYIPQSTIDKPPSAELRPDQKDADSLPPYDVLDEILRLLIEERRSTAEVAVELGQPQALVADIAGKLHRAEFKRWQFPLTLRVSGKAWVGRVYPIVHRFFA